MGMFHHKNGCFASFMYVILHRKPATIIPQAYVLVRAVTKKIKKIKVDLAE